MLTSDGDIEDCKSFSGLPSRGRQDYAKTNVALGVEGIHCRYLILNCLCMISNLCRKIKSQELSIWSADIYLSATNQ